MPSISFPATEYFCRHPLSQILVISIKKVKAIFHQQVQQNIKIGHVGRTFISLLYLYYNLYITAYCKIILGAAHPITVQRWRIQPHWNKPPSYK